MLIGCLPRCRGCGRGRVVVDGLGPMCSQAQGSTSWLGSTCSGSGSISAAGVARSRSRRCGLHRRGRGVLRPGRGSRSRCPAGGAGASGRAAGWAWRPMRDRHRDAHGPVVPADLDDWPGRTGRRPARLCVRPGRRRLRRCWRAWRPWPSWSRCGSRTTRTPPGAARGRGPSVLRQLPGVRGGGAGLGVHGVVVDGLDPRREQLVQPGQVADRCQGRPRRGTGLSRCGIPVSIFPRPSGFPGRLWIRRTPSTAHARSSEPDTKPDPLSR